MFKIVLNTTINKIKVFTMAASQLSIVCGNLAEVHFTSPDWTLEEWAEHWLWSQLMVLMLVHILVADDF